MSHKLIGCCSLCDARCFEVLAVWEDHERFAGEPKRLGKPFDGVIRVTFLLFNGTLTDMTFCAECAAKVGPQVYATLWRRNLAGWLREQDGRTESFADEFSNGLLCELGRKSWKELVANGR